MRYAFLAAISVILVATATTLHSGEREHPKGRGQISAAAQKEIKAVELEIDRIEAEAVNNARLTTLDRFQQIILLGKLIFYDNQLSVMRNESCASCHMPETGFSGPVSELNQTTVAYPGSVRTRFGKRRPQAQTSLWINRGSIFIRIHARVLVRTDRIVKAGL